LAIASGGNVFSAAAVGFADAATQRRLTPQTIMRVGSIQVNLVVPALAGGPCRSPVSERH
jgi:hypothetical protein